MVSHNQGLFPRVGSLAWQFGGKWILNQQSGRCYELHPFVFQSLSIHEPTEVFDKAGNMGTCSRNSGVFYLTKENFRWVSDCQV